MNLYFASLKYTSPTFLASMYNTIASLTFVIALALRFETFYIMVWVKYIFSLYNFYFYFVLVPINTLDILKFQLTKMQIWGCWSSKSTWDSKSTWHHDLVSWCYDHDTIQRTYNEKLVGSSNSYSTKKCFSQWELVKGFTCYNFMLCHNFYRLHYAGSHLNSWLVFSWQMLASNLKETH